MMKRRNLLLLASTLPIIGTGCAAKRSTPNTFTAPPEGKSNIYVFQNTDGTLGKIATLGLTALWDSNVNITLTEMDLGKTHKTVSGFDPSNYAMFTVEPGVVSLKLHWASRILIKELTVEPNKNYYYTWTSRSAGNAGGPLFTRISEPNALRHIRYRNRTY